MLNNQPLVSIITPNFNTEKFVAKTIESVLKQTYDNWEMIIVDDASTDKSVEIIKKYASNEPRIHLIQLDKNNGQGNARNIATKFASGDYIAFLDSDDIWHPDKITIHIRFMLEKNADFSHTSYGFIDESDNRIMQTYHVSSYPVSYKNLLKRTEIGCLTVIYKIKTVGKRFMPLLKRKQDYALWLEILKDGFVSHPLDEELAYYRQRKGSTTNNKFNLIIDHYKFLRRTQSLNPFLALYYTLAWGLNGLKKYYL